ncbi:MAG: phosphomannomutase/phosphoglucomutase, partial [Candidatus Cloacimonetes bacterium]|nr:phosphomannomutase/phosphoglucomutase [Candidatus Cloacimonadota bacterium]
MLNQQIFREYDIRGVVDKDLTDIVVEDIALSFGTYLRNKDLKSIAIGSDCRLSSDRFRQIFSASLVKTGCEVKDVGTVPTPVLYFAIEQLNTDGGVMITGSHNPPEFNGFKLCVGTFSIYGKEIQKIREIIEDEVYIAGNGKYEKYNKIIQDYQNYLVDNLSLEKKLKVVIDSGNGTAGPVAPQIFKKLGCDVISLYDDMDGNFPNHHPDPTVVEYIEELISTVKEEHADVGIGFDGDSDRIGVVDENGNIIWGDQLLMIFARDVLETNPRSIIISEVKSSKNLYDDIQSHNGIPIMWKTGHSLIKQKMKEEGALLGGEMSGHMFFADRYFGFDDAIYAAGRLLEILSRSDTKLSELLADVPKTFNTPEIRFDCPDEIKFDVVEQVKNYFSKKNYDINDIDGMRITFVDGWALVRASNTQPVLVLRFESTSQERLNEIQQMITEKVQEFI